MLVTRPSRECSRKFLTEKSIPSTLLAELFLELNGTTSSPRRSVLPFLWSIQRLRGYLQGEKFTVITDHHYLLWLNNLRDPTGRLARWNTALQMYNIDFVHREGALHKVPVALSRAWEGTYEVTVIARVEILGIKRKSRMLRKIQLDTRIGR